MKNLIKKQKQHPYVIGIGASAGGVSAIQSFFSTVTSAKDICYIVFLHSDPTQKSLLTELISQKTHVPVLTIKHNLPVQAGSIYIVPENCDIKIREQHFKLINANFESCQRNPIDNLFIEIAKAYNEKAIAVVLSGSGNDGSQGCLSIKQRKGLVAIQEFDEAKFSDMPRHVSSSISVDILTTAATMNTAIQAFINQTVKSILQLDQEPELQTTLTCIFDLLKLTTSHDFSSYKQKTLLRRIQRRMLNTNTVKLEDYATLLARHEPERFKLMAELLIGVTQFFRDDEIWQLLHHKTLPELLHRSVKSQSFRAWVAGCASGEEAYSLAFLLFDLKNSDTKFKHVHIQLFATDLNQYAIEFARKGTYPTKISKQFTAEQLNRYFDLIENNYVVKAKIRELIVFAPHNILSDPPFTKLNLICCRNVMIYMTQTIHQQLFKKFHYCLNTQGLLLLGTAESIDNFNPYFTITKNNVSLYKKQTLINDELDGYFPSNLHSFEKLSAAQKVKMTPKQPIELQQYFAEHIKTKLSPAAILVNSQGTILNIFGDTSAYLTPMPGKADLTIHSMAKDFIHHPLLEAFHNAQETDSVNETIIALKTNVKSSNKYVRIRIEPFTHNKLKNLWLIAFQHFTTQSVLPVLSHDKLEDQHQLRVRFLEKSLLHSQHETQTAKEEMQTSSEELMSTNEELQSTNEELTTSTEELRTMNEQLLQARQQAEQSLANYTDLFDSAPVGYFTVNRQGKILHVNRVGKALLTESDEDQVSSRLNLYIVEQHRSIFLAQLESAFRENTAQNCDVSLWRDGVNLRYVSINISPPNDSEHCRVIISDITEKTIQQQKLKESEARYHRILNGTNDGLWEWDIINDSTYVSPRWQQLLGYQANELTEKSNVFYSHLHADDKNRFKLAINAHLKQHETFDLELRLKTKHNKYKWFQCKAVAVRNEQNIPVLLSGILSDIHQRKLLQHQEANKNKILQLTAKNAPLDKILSEIITLLEQDNPDMICSILLLDESGEHLYNCIGPKLPEFYRQAIEGVTIGEGVGSCGTAAFRKKRIIVENIQTDPLWINFKDLAKKANLAACWSQPIINGKNNVLGTFAIYHETPIAPTDDDINIINHQTILAEIAIDHFNTMKQLKMASLVFENSSEASMVFNSDDIILAVNPAFTRITGYSEDEIVGKNRGILRSKKHAENFYQTKTKTLNAIGRWQGESWGKHKDGHYYAQWMTISTIYDADGNVEKRIALFSDITERKKSEEIIWQQANFDSLTGLPNRRMFFDRLKQATKRTRRDHQKLAVMLLDLDNFKEINDVYGHDQGDLLLIEVTKRIQQCIRQSDILARLGGDEFTIVVTEVKNERFLEQIAQQIIKSLQPAISLNDHIVYITASIGITVFPDDGENVDRLLKHADQAMYQAKGNGKNSFSYFTSAMHHAAENRLNLINDLREAIKEQQFTLYYQPIINSKNNCVKKAEVLVRWLHPTKGIISPDQFIPLAEETGLIIELGDWIFKTAVKQMHQWQTTINAEFSLSINVSPVQFLQSDNIIKQWLAFLKENKISSKNINIEITEGLLLDANSFVNEQLKLLAEHGINVSIDDFGTGYSSLSYLKKFDIDYLKIDKSFVDNLATDKNDQALCQAIIVMAHQLGMMVIAEGVETKKQSELLTQAGCDFLQGYYFAKPLPLLEFEEFTSSFK
jgi:diguanylate cyclase (GGDEF)-like protein/PAS domain S-box-containing protein